MLHGHGKQGGFEMLKLTIKPGEFINIGNDIRVVYSGGTDGNIHLLIDAPRELNIVRSKVLSRKKDSSENNNPHSAPSYYAEPKLSQETVSKIRHLIKEDKNTKKIILRISMVILFIINTNQIVMSSTFLFN